MSGSAIKIYVCGKCGHEWAGRPKVTDGKEPKVCPQCKNPDWRNPRVRRAHTKQRRPETH